MPFRGPKFSASVRRIGSVVLVVVANRSGSVLRCMLSGVDEGTQVIVVRGNDTYRGVHAAAGAVEIADYDVPGTTLASLAPPEETSSDA